MTIRCIGSLESENKIGRYLASLDACGVVLDYVLFSTDPGDANDLERHRAIATAGMQLMSDRLEQYFDNLQKEIQENPDQFPWLDPETLAEDERASIEFSSKDASGSFIDEQTFRTVYTKAFCEPPHGFQQRNAEAPALCTESLSILAGTVSEYSIVSWSDDWSTYFDDGKEWWGSYLWTLLHPEGTALWIGGSTTD